jgi:hypothetical protein
MTVGTGPARLEGNSSKNREGLVAMSVIRPHRTRGSALVILVLFAVVAGVVVLALVTGVSVGSIQAPDRLPSPHPVGIGL